MKQPIPKHIKESISVFLSRINYQPIHFAFLYTLCYWSENGDNLETLKRRYRAYNSTVNNYLKKRYLSILTDRASMYTIGDPNPEAPIWVFWWQGYQNSPEIVRICIDSIYKNANGRRVIVVDQNNYIDYVDLPEYIIAKQKSNHISLTHFSDILRVNLLATHGGCWLDATIFCTRPIDDVIFDMPFFTCRNPGKEIRNTSEWNWTGYAMWGWQHNYLFCLMRDFFNLYWKDHDNLIDYFLIDHGIRLLYDSFSFIHDQIQSVPINNSSIYELNKQLDDPYTQDDYSRIMRSDTWLYKLTWKKSYTAESADGTETTYGRWIMENRSSDIIGE